MEINALINSIYEGDEIVKLELVQLMRFQIEQNQNVIIGDLKRVFILIETLLSNTSDKDLIIQVHNLIETLINHLLPTEVEQNIPLVWQSRLFLQLSNLANTDSSIRKSTKRVFISFIRRTRNFEEVARVIVDMGMRDSNFYVRERCLNLIPDALSVSRNIFQSRSGLNEARRVIEAVLVHLNDNQSNVREQAERVARKLKKMNMENFDSAFKRISVEHQQLFAKAVNVNQPSEFEQKFMKVNLDSLEEESFVKSDAMELSSFFNSDQINQDIGEWNKVRGIYKQFLSNPIGAGQSVEKIMQLFPQNLLTKLYFGFLRSDILQDCLNERDSKIREYGIKQLNECFFELNPEEEQVPDLNYNYHAQDNTEGDVFYNMKSNALPIISKQGFLPQFYKFITYMLTNEKENQIVNILMNIINKVMTVPGVNVSTYLALSLPGLVKCLDDQRVIIRKRSFFLLRKLIFYMKKKQFLMNIVFFLDDVAKNSYDNWHAKEELLNLICIIILETKPTEQWLYGPKQPNSNNKHLKHFNQINDLKKSRNQDILKNYNQDINSDDKIYQGINYTSSAEEPQTQTIYRLNFTKILIRIAYFLDDKIPKVKQAALECLAVLSHSIHKQEFLEILFSVLDKKVYDLLIDKLESNRVYFLNSNGNLELPHIDVKKLEKKRNEYLKQQQEYEQLRQKQQDEQFRKEEQERIEQDLIKQWEDERNLRLKENPNKVTYYEAKKTDKKPQFTISMQDRIAKSNRSIASLFVDQNTGIGSVRYDVLIPIDEIKMTQFRGNHNEINQNVKQDQMSQNLYILKEDKRQMEFEEFEITDEDEDDEELGSEDAEEYKLPKKATQRYPEEQIKISQVRQNSDIRKIVLQNILQLNEQSNVDTQIPKSLQINVSAYQGYKYNERDEDNESLDIPPIKYQQPQMPQMPKVIIKTAIKDQDNQVLIAPDVVNLSNEQKYQKRLQNFLITFENKEIDKQRGRNAKKLKMKIRERKQDDLPIINGMRILSEELVNRPLQSPTAEVGALLINLQVLDIKKIFDTITSLRILIRNHVEVIYMQQIPLDQIVLDLCRILSPTRENPLYKCDFSSFKGNIQNIVRVVALNALNALSECALSFKKNLDRNTKIMFQAVGIWLQDEYKDVSNQAEQTLIDIVKSCEDSELSSILPRLFDRESFSAKVYVGVLIENLIQKWKHGIFRSVHFKQIIKIISIMISDEDFDIRRQGKKVLFKLLNLQGDHQNFELAFMDLNSQEVIRMKELILLHQELQIDNQIGNIVNNGKYTNFEIDQKEFLTERIRDLHTAQIPIQGDFRLYRPSSNHGQKLDEFDDPDIGQYRPSSMKGKKLDEFDDSDIGYYRPSSVRGQKLYEYDDFDNINYK